MHHAGTGTEHTDLEREVGDADGTEVCADAVPVVEVLADKHILLHGEGQDGGEDCGHHQEHEAEEVIAEHIHERARRRAAAQLEE